MLFVFKKTSDVSSMMMMVMVMIDSHVTRGTQRIELMASLIANVAESEFCAMLEVPSAERCFGSTVVIVVVVVVLFMTGFIRSSIFVAEYVGPRKSRQSRLRMYFRTH